MLVAVALFSSPPEWETGHGCGIWSVCRSCWVNPERHAGNDGKFGVEVKIPTTFKRKTDESAARAPAFARLEQGPLLLTRIAPKSRFGSGSLIHERIRLGCPAVWRESSLTFNISRRFARYHRLI